MAFIPENRLEEALVAAVANPAAAPDFYRLLLDSTLLVLGTAEGHEYSDRPFELSPDTRLNLVPAFKDGQRYLPVFSSLTRMQDHVKAESKYLSLNGRMLMEITRGAPLILNPNSDYGREFTPAEIAQLLDPKPTGEAKRMIGETDYPMALVDTLTALFATRPEIAAAWMIQVTFADRAKEPHPLVGIETDAGSDWLALVRAIQAAAERGAPGMVFDVQQVLRLSPTTLTQALLSVPPFYERRSFSGTLN